MNLIIDYVIKSNDSIVCYYIHKMYSNKGSLYRQLLYVSVNKKWAVSFREGNLMMHKESPSEKNSFLQDLDKLDVSIYGGSETGLQLEDA